MLTHVIGDSHALTFGGAYNVERHWLGPATAFQLYKKNLEIQDIIANVNREDNIWFIFGEIDCRVHIYAKSNELGLSVDFLAELTANQYLKYINNIKNNTIIPVTVLAIIPQGYADNSWCILDFAPREVRQNITKLYNGHLERISKEIGINFINFWPEDLSIEYYDYDSKGKSPGAHLRNEVVWDFVNPYLIGG